MGIRTKVRTAGSFVRNDVWNVDLDGLGRWSRSATKTLRIVLLTMKTFSSQKIGFQSVALSFFCTMAAVPFVAVAFAVTKGVGLADKLEAFLTTSFPHSPEVIQYVMTYADNILAKATSSTLGLISAAFFIWLVIWMMLCVETVFNNVWKVRKSRSLYVRIWRDAAIVVISPFLMLSLYGGAILLSGVMHVGLIKWPLILIISTLTFSAMYKFIPNTKVYYENALKASFFSGIAYTLIQFVYVESQIFLTRLSGIYGAVAAIPFFMFWLNFSWYVILVGAELSYAFQNVNDEMLLKELNGRTK